MVKDLLVAGMSRVGRQLRIRDPALSGINPTQKEETFMKGNPEVIGRLQEAADIEASLMLQYLLDQRDVKRWAWIWPMA
jgi:hypothetical protein